jgi:hypothetical protein
MLVFRVLHGGDVQIYRKIVRTEETIRCLKLIDVPMLSVLFLYLSKM